MNKIALIPARGGSKRIPKKNIKDFLGKPIIAYSIDKAINSGVFDRIVVSTDCPEVKAVAESFGAEVPFIRPQQLSDDHTGTNEVVKHAIGELGLQPDDLISCIYATAPFIQEKYIRSAYEQIIGSDKSYAFTVTSFPFPVQRGLLISPDQEISPLQPEHIFTRSQDLPEVFHDAGQFYFGWCKSYLNDEIVFSNRSIPILLPRHQVQDIDTPEDWLRAEAMYRAIISG